MTVRAVARLAAIILLLLACLPSWAIASVFGCGPFWVRVFLAGVGRILGLSVRVEGAPARGGALYAANHISWLDILALGGATPARFIAKAEIARWPAIGWLATLGGSVYVDRERRSATRAQASEVTAALGEGRPVTLFAEGSTGDGVTLAPFRPSLFAAAVEAGAAVQPVAIDYGARAPEIAWPDDAGFAAEIKRMLARRGPVPVTLRFAPPLDARTMDRKALAGASYRAVARALSR